MAGAIRRRGRADDGFGKEPPAHQPGQQVDRDHEEQGPARLNVHLIGKGAHGVRREGQETPAEIVQEGSPVEILQAMALDQIPGLAKRGLGWSTRSRHGANKLPVRQGGESRKERARPQQASAPRQGSQQRERQDRAYTIEEVLQVTQEKERCRRGCPQPASPHMARLAAEVLHRLRQQQHEHRQRQRKADETVVQRQVVREREGQQRRDAAATTGHEQ